MTPVGGARLRVPRAIGPEACEMEQVSAALANFPYRLGEILADPPFSWLSSFYNEGLPHPDGS